MGRKHNKRNKQRRDDDSFSEDEDVDGNGESSNKDTTTTTTTTTTKKKQDGAVVNMKELDFVERRELQRKQAAEKRRTKMKCYLCGKVGHVRRECNGIQDDGRGMSRYKGKSNTKQEKRKYLMAQRKKQQTMEGNDGDDNAGGPALDYPEELQEQEQLDFLYYDVSCDVQSTIDYCKQGRGKHKISYKEAYQEYQHALEDADIHTNFGGMITKSILKPNRPWIVPNETETTPLPEKTWYMIGLSNGYLYNDNEMDTTIQALVDTLSTNSCLVIGYWVVLDYTSTYCEKPGCDKESQLRRFKATCEAAGQTGSTIQVQVLPGAGSLEDPNESVSGTEYAAVLKSFLEIFTEMVTKYPQIKLVLMDWTGLSQHMLSFLQGFPENLYIGLTGAVGFSKAVHIHECAFEIPLDRLVLATTTVIPSEIANTLGRDAFYHSGLWSFVAAAVAKYKKTVTVLEVARAASKLSLRLYPQLEQGHPEGMTGNGDGDQVESNEEGESDADAGDVEEEGNNDDGQLNS